MICTKSIFDIVQGLLIVALTFFLGRGSSVGSDTAGDARGTAIDNHVREILS